MKLDLSSLENINASDVPFIYVTTNDWYLMHVKLMIKCGGMEYFISKDDTGFLVVVDKIRKREGVYRIFAESQERFMKGMESIVKIDTRNSQPLYIRVHGCFEQQMKELYKRNGLTPKGMKYNFWAVRGDQLPEADNQMVSMMAQGACKGDVQLAPYIMKDYQHAIFYDEAEKEERYIKYILSKFPSSVINDEKGVPVTYCCTHVDGSLGVGHTRQDMRHKGLNSKVVFLNYIQMCENGKPPLVFAEIAPTDIDKGLAAKTPMRIVDSVVYMVGIKQKANL